jgi:chaperonin cofactor prefoldin
MFEEQKTPASFKGSIRAESPKAELSSLKAITLRHDSEVIVLDSRLKDVEDKDEIYDQRFKALEAADRLKDEKIDKLEAADRLKDEKIYKLEVRGAKDHEDLKIFRGEIIDIRGLVGTLATEFTLIKSDHLAYKKHVDYMMRRAGPKESSELESRITQLESKFEELQKAAKSGDREKFRGLIRALNHLKNQIDELFKRIEELERAPPVVALQPPQPQQSFGCFVM